MLFVDSELSKRSSDEESPLARLHQHRDYSKERLGFTCAPIFRRKACCVTDLDLVPTALMPISPRPQVELEKTYNSAADHYDHPAVSFWDRYGRRTVDRLPLISGMAVLDVCCGMGASAIPAAERVGPAGHVIAVVYAAARRLV
jgi:2-polyprenyl-3-methyl-5-hydroxy-6-metoxy-1,4-benzoquinol methylase